MMWLIKTGLMSLVQRIWAQGLTWIITGGIIFLTGLSFIQYQRYAAVSAYKAKQELARQRAINIQHSRNQDIQQEITHLRERLRLEQVARNTVVDQVKARLQRDLSGKCVWNRKTLKELNR